MPLKLSLYLRLFGHIVSILPLSLVSGQFSQNVLTAYPVNWTSVGVQPSGKNLTANCICDLKAFQCDVGCCCDPFCPAGLVTLNEDAGTCLPEGPPADTLTFCVPNGYVSKVNLPSSSDFYALVLEPSNRNNFWEELLCIVGDNNPNLGREYPDPEAGPVGDNAVLAQCPAVQSPSSTPTNYLFRSYVQIQRSGSTATTTLRVPYPVFSAECNDQFQLGYLLPLPSSQENLYSTCTRTLEQYNLPTVCGSGGLFTPGYFSAFNFLTGKGSTNLPQAVNVVSMQFMDPTTGYLTEVNPNNTVSAWDATNQVCRNVAAFVNYTMYYSLTDPTDTNTPGYLLQVDASFVITDVRAASSSFQQNIKVNWLDADQQGRATLQQFSGNPGYIKGFPVLAGTLVNLTDSAGTRSSIQRLTGGLPLGAPGAGGACSALALAPVRYGFNASSTCSVSLTAEQLRDYCVNNSTLPDRYMQSVLDGLYPSLLQKNMYAGIWGNSNTSNVDTEWVKVEVSGPPFASLIYSATDNACSGVVTGFDLQVLVGSAFAANNIQRKVLYVNLCFRTGTFDFNEELTPAGGADKFYLNFTVSFVPLPQQAVSVSRPTPPLAVPLPADLFYPFVTSAAPHMAAPLAPLTLLLLALLLLVML